MDLLLQEKTNLEYSNLLLERKYNDLQELINYVNAINYAQFNNLVCQPQLNVYNLQSCEPQSVPQQLYYMPQPQVYSQPQHYVPHGVIINTNQPLVEQGAPNISTVVQR